MTEHYLQAVLTFFQQHPHIGELLAFVIAMAESLPLIGTVIPGSVTMTAIGTMIGSGVLPTYTTIAWASLGALTGDCIGFAIGYYFNEAVRNVWPFKKHPKWLTVGEDFFRKHGGKSIIFGRFVGPARSTVPMIAGLLKMSWPRFLIAAIPSAIMWALLYTVPGILLGALALEVAPAKMTEFVIIGLIIIVAIWFVFWAIQYFFKALANYINKKVDILWTWLNHHHSSRFLIRAITNQQKPSDHHQLTMVLTALFSLLLYLILFASVITKNFLTALNQPVFHFLQSIHTHFLDGCMLAISLILYPQVLTVVVVVVCSFLAVFKQWRAATHLFLLNIANSSCIVIMRHLYHSQRPVGFVVDKASSSFPSGHVITSVVTLGFIAFLFCQTLKQKRHWIPYTTTGVVLFLLGFSRLYLGAHWLTDVIGAALLGLTLLLITLISYRRFPLTRSQFSLTPLKWSAGLIVTLLLPMSAYCIHSFYKPHPEYTPYTMDYEVREQQWWADPIKYLPTYRNNRFGRAIQPFNLQWAGKLTAIANLLQKHGWKIVGAKKSVETTLERFATRDPQYHMPLFPLLYLNKPPKLILMKTIPHKKSIYEVRLWQTRVTLDNKDYPLWIGTIEAHAPSHKLLTLKHRYAIYYTPKNITQLLDILLNGLDIKRITIEAADQPEHIQKTRWDGSILIIRPRS